MTGNVFTGTHVAGPLLNPRERLEIPHCLRRASLLLAALSLVFAGCATSRAPAEEKLALARSAIERAERARAVDLAPVQIADAREKLRRAEAAREREPEDAVRLAEKAEADALLAEVTARSQVFLNMARESDATLEALRAQAARSGSADAGPAPSP